MRYVIYMSTSVKLMGDEDLKKILRQSQVNNTLNNITGMLLYSEGSFVQVLEGNEPELEQAFEKIKQDERHKGIIKLVESELDERLFPNWSMGFKTVSPDQISKFDAYIDLKGSELLQQGKYHPAITILKTFADANQF